MKVRTVAEIQSIDDDLHLFDEAQWDFMSVVDSQDVNYEYFNDIRDTDFDKRAKVRLKASSIPILFSCLALVICVGIGIKLYSILELDSDYKRLMNAQSVAQPNNALYIEGESGTSKDIIEISSVLNKYFNCLRASSDYKDLDNCCVDSSSFANTYYSAVDKVKEVYDTNDCYARALRAIGSSCSLNKVNGVVIKDNVYYCYASVNTPVTSDISEYIYMYAYNFTKKFNNQSVSEAELIKYLLELFKSYSIPCTSSEVCFKFEKNGDKYYLVDDSYINELCKEDYFTAVNHLSSILGSNLSSRN